MKRWVKEAPFEAIASWPNPELGLPRLRPRSLGPEPSTIVVARSLCYVMLCYVYHYIALPEGHELELYSGESGEAPRQGADS